MRNLEITVTLVNGRETDLINFENLCVRQNGNKVDEMPILREIYPKIYPAMRIE